MRVAAIQMVSGPNPQQNYERAEHWLRLAHAEGADIAVLPENFVTYAQKIKPQLSEQKEFLSRMEETAKSLGIWLIAGSYPLGSQSLGLNAAVEAEKPYAASMVFDDKGCVRAHYLKIHLFDAVVADSVKSYRESDDFLHGADVCAVASPFCTFGVAICYDLRFPELFTALVKQGCKVIFLPSAFTEATGRAHWEVLLRARAIESQCYIVAPNQGGVHEKGRSTWGHTMIVSPWGEIISQLNIGEGLLVEDLDLARLDDIRRNMPIQQHRRLI